MRRIGAALVQLLDERPLQDIPVAELCTRADASVSSFYARFSDKAAVLDWMKDEYFREARRMLGERLDPDRWANATLPEIIDWIVRTYVAFLRDHAPVLRAIVLENRARPRSKVAARSEPLNLLSYERITALVLARREEIRHPDPEFAAAFGLTAVYAASHEFVLFPDTGLHPLRMSDAELVAALSQMYLSVLGVRSDDPGGAAERDDAAP